MIRSAADQAHLRSEHSIGQIETKLLRPSSIQKIKDVEKITFVQRVELDIPNDRIGEAITNVGLPITEVARLYVKLNEHGRKAMQIALVMTVQLSR